jgi:hypothetical protein
MIDVRRQSGTHIEAKITLAIPKEKKSTLEVKYYLFTPEHLHINGDNYTTQHFLTKLQSHGRYSSPELSLTELLDRNNELSMLTILERYTARLTTGNDSVETTKFISELQELVNSVRHITKHSVRSYKRMHTLSPDEEIESHFASYINGLKDFRTRFFELLKKVRDKKSTLKQYWTGILWADEAISLLIEENAIQLFRLLKEEDKAEKLRMELQKIGQMEQIHRKAEEYESADPRSELFSLRKADLKKWSQSVMYLRPKYSRLPKQIGQICAGIAAAIAMTFATVASILAENVYLKNSLQWALVVIIAYVFKDRIKEWLRILLTRFIPRLMADEMYTLNSPRHGVPLAKCRNIVTFTAPANVDEQVLLKRKKGSNLSMICFRRKTSSFSPGTSPFCPPSINSRRCAPGSNGSRSSTESTSGIFSRKWMIQAPCSITPARTALTASK